MNVEIRRQGIVIKSVPVTSDRVRIGSGDVCEIQLNDRYLAPVVAELVRRGQEWRIVDAGVSMEGVTRGGSRVMDERLESGESYIVGAFELVIDPHPLSRASREVPTDNGSIPMTMMEANLGLLPSTMVQGAKPAPAGNLPGRATDGKLAFAPIEAPRQMPPARGGEVRGSVPGSTRRRVLLIAAVVVATICIGLALVVGTGDSKKRSQVRPSDPVATKPAPAPAAVRGASGDELAANLEIDKAFAAWETEFAAKPTAELRDKIVSGALELARAYAAAHDAQTAARYFEKVVRYGDPSSDAVRLARSRVAPQG